MLYRPRISKRSRLTWLLGAATFGIGMWVGGYLAYFHDSPQIDSNQLDASQSAEFPSASRYIGRSFSGHYLAGRFAESQRQEADAALYLMQAIRLRNDDTKLMQDALHTLVAAGKLMEASQIATRLMEQKIKDPLAALVQVSYLARQRQFADALPYAELPDEKGIYAMIKPMLRQWLAAGERLPLEKPVQMPDVIDRAGFLAPFMHYQLALINDMAGHADEAERHYKSALGTPDLMPFRVMQATSNFYLRQGKKKKALQVFNEYARQNPDSELMEPSLPQADKPAQSVVPIVENPAQGMAEIFFTTASLLFGEQITDEAMIYLQLALYLHPDFPPAQMMMANLYEQSGHYAQAIETYKSIDPGTRFYQRGQLRMAMNYHLLGDQQKATGLLKQLQTEQPTDPEPLTTMGDLLRVNKDYKQAIYYYSEAIDKHSKDKKAEWSLYYTRGICYERSGQWKEAEADFAKALELSPNQPDVMNYLGYSWLVKGENLAHAIHYIDLALQQRPSDAHIIDSMGWALNVTGRFDEALEYMEQAADLAPQDATINDHLGDVYWRLGRTVEARYQWERALLFEPEDAKAIQEKIDNGLPEFVTPSKEAMGDFEAPVAAADSEKPADTKKTR